MRFNYFKSPISKKFDPRKVLEGFETLERAKEDRAKLIQMLAGVDTTVAKRLAKRLSGCRSGEHRCRSASCSVCGRRFRAWWTDLGCSLMAQEDKPWYRVSLVPPHEKYTEGNLHKFKPAAAKDRLRKQLERSEVSKAKVFGGIDFAFQVTEGQKGFWRPHYYFFIRTSKKKATSVFGGLYEADKHTRRPAIIKRVGSESEDLVAVVSYSLKMIFQKKVPGLDNQGNSKPVGRPLEDKHLLELAPLLHRWGFGARIIRRNLQDTEKMKFR